MAIAIQVILQIRVVWAEDNQLQVQQELVLVYTMLLVQDHSDKAAHHQDADAKVTAAAADGTEVQEAEIAEAAAAEADTFSQQQAIRQ